MIFAPAKPVDEDRNFCDNSCQIVATSWQVFCASRLKGTCAGAAIVVISDLERTCHECCEGDGFYKNCVKPYETALKQRIKEYVDTVYQGVSCVFDW